MSNKDLDSLFKNKLEDYEKQPSKHLWSAIDAQLPEKNKKPSYWLLGIAASLLLLFGVGIGFYISHTEIEQNEHQLTNKTESTNKTEIIEQPKKEVPLITSDNDVLALNESDEKTAEKTIQTKQKKVVTNSSKKTVRVEKNDEKPITEEKVDEIKPLPLEVTSEKNIEQLDVSNATTVANKASEKQDVSNTIVFDIKEFTKENTAVLASANEEKKESKLKQLFNIAKDIKEGESGLSDLREAKNDLFALNSRKNEKGR
ncbi:hypothetical protein [Fulvivirga lutea]|uniref:Uncharacterized protein n=1 Tax=Fulvivirga lutea TaxID=2810512 RepID=A0A974ZZC7_9BACT|nr:hypothetical protein [Fulvivirga lutea]QSE96024.1 hypothetical protein JR347_10390 [Fulvivirga lutea]